MVGKVTADTSQSCSQLPAIMGLSPWSSQNEVLATISAARDGEPRPWVPRAAQEETMNWGSRMEPVVAEQALERLHLEGILGIQKPMIHPELPLQASLDGIAYGTHAPWRTGNGIFVFPAKEGVSSVHLQGEGPLEIKLTSATPDDEVPLWRGPLQLQGQMMCMDARWGALAVLYCGRGFEMRIYIFEEDPATQEAITAAVYTMEQHLESGEPFPVTAPDDVPVAYPVVQQTGTKILPEEAAQIVNDLADAQATISSMNKVVKATTAALMEIMGNHEYAATEEWQIQWPMRKVRAKPAEIKPEVIAHEVRAKSLKLKPMEDVKGVPL